MDQILHCDWLRPRVITRCVPQEEFLRSRGRFTEIFFPNLWREKYVLWQLKIYLGLCIHGIGKRKNWKPQRELSKENKNIDEFHEFNFETKIGKHQTQNDMKVWKRFFFQEKENS